MIGAFISLIMRLSESLFRPMFLKVLNFFPTYKEVTTILHISYKLI